MILAIKGLQPRYNYGEIKFSNYSTTVYNYTACAPVPRINRGITNCFPITRTSWIHSLQFAGFEELMTSCGKYYERIQSKCNVSVLYYAFSLLHLEFIMQ